MYVKPTQVSDLVRKPSDAQKIIAELLVRFGSEAAQERIADVAREQHQTAEEVASRTAGNLLNSFVTRRYDVWSL